MIPNPNLNPHQESLETNGIGGYSSATISGAHSRRYHGLLIAATDPPVGRTVLLSRFEERLVIDGGGYDISTNNYPGTVYPEGYRYMVEFRLDPFPIFTYLVEGIEVEKRIFMIHGENSVVVEYSIKNDHHATGRAISLELRPLIAYRDHHALGHERGDLDPTVTETAPHNASIKPYSTMPALHFAHSAERVTTTGYWYHNIELEIERERGFDYHEDLFNPCEFRFNVDEDTPASVIISTTPHDIGDVDRYRAGEINRREQLLDNILLDNVLLDDTSSLIDSETTTLLLRAADNFIVERGATGSTVIAGYHWFGDWGRDTMIALPGLTLATGRFDIARDILLEFAQYVDRGMIPNRFPDSGSAPEYNTVDGTLWFIEAIRSYEEATGDFATVRERFYPIVVDIIEWHQRGTRYNIKVDDDGLLNSGEDGLQLTWMDAKVGDHVITPRQGKPVEIQALWYNALMTAEDFARRFGDMERSAHYGAMASRAKRSFNKRFWNSERGCLYDVIDGNTIDASIRPNQLFAASLHYTMLSEGRARAMVATVESRLLTPMGVRTLDPADPRYHGRYEGDPAERDSRYHQGTVWPWLLGPFITALLKSDHNSKRARATEIIDAFLPHLSEGCIGQIAEIADGDSPHTSRGCCAQAWSVAEILRVGVGILQRHTELQL